MRLDRVARMFYLCSQRDLPGQQCDEHHFHGIESEALLILLDRDGICASSGSACLADSDEPSHVIKAMKPESGASRQMIRFSLDVATSQADISAALAALLRITKMLRDSG